MGLLSEDKNYPSLKRIFERAKMTPVLGTPVFILTTMVQHGTGDPHGRIQQGGLPMAFLVRVDCLSRTTNSRKSGRPNFAEPLTQLIKTAPSLSPTTGRVPNNALTPLPTPLPSPRLPSVG